MEAIPLLGSGRGRRGGKPSTCTGFQQRVEVPQPSNDVCKLREYRQEPARSLGRSVQRCGGRNALTLCPRGQAESRRGEQAACSLLSVLLSACFACAVLS
jgi:hypothetical protein